MPAAANLSNGQTDWDRNLGRCSHSGAQLHIGLFNGGSNDDLLCGDTNTGHRWIVYSGP